MLNKCWKIGAKYFHFDFNNSVTTVSKDAHGMVNCHIAVLDVQFKINEKHSVRAELQGLWTKTETIGGISQKQDKGDWATFLLEYNISPKFYFAAMDQYNYGNPIESRRVHCLMGTAGYIFGSGRISILYGKQREGIFVLVAYAAQCLLQTVSPLPLLPAFKL